MGVQAAPTTPAESAPPAESGRTGANAPAAGTGSTPPSGSESQEQVSRGPDLIRQAFANLRGRTTQTYAPAPQAPPASGNAGSESEQPGTSAPKPGRSPATTLPGRSPAAAPTPANPQAGRDNAIVLTPEELARRVQSETDRRLAKAEADRRAHAEREEEQRLRRDDPFEYVRRLEARETEQKDQEARLKESVGLLEEQLTHYDRGILDPIVGALPEPTRKKILSGIQAEGIPGRQEIARQSLAALRAHWNAEGRETARATLMRDEKFVKEVLARYGGQRDDGPPEVTAGLPPASASRPVTDNDAVNGWMRSAGSAARSVSGSRR